ncbi:ComEA family DNA-binding protein [Fuchsiella alkaliacetigena]|uniref:ComEA family DNA-binding protein n=1 Tax=Fuchsiella alkaliacetigena TaxID=957042 RepID=UPI00200AE125|nr:helix-hairpin-helix domain-containing protein [Fuchsiella alkaliacetigena]MCK8825532.1 helix-hairpin-helix domain-containing protein [Fuchsiella alkaliacetigena]
MGVLELNDKLREYIEGKGSADLNTVSAEELRKVKGIGKKTSERIISYREEEGPFKEIEDLKEIPGIGKAVIDRVNQLFIAN